MATALVFPIVGFGNAASADPVDLACVGAATFNFSPGVTLAAQTVNITGTVRAGDEVSPLTPCSSPLTGMPYTGGHGTISGTGTLACTPVGLGFPPQLAGNIQATVPITWNNGDVSVVSVDVTAVGPIPVVTATISSGAMQGSTGTGVPALTALTGNCLLTPVTSLSLAGVAVAIRG